MQGEEDAFVSTAKKRVGDLKKLLLKGGLNHDTLYSMYSDDLVPERSPSLV